MNLSKLFPSSVVFDTNVDLSKLTTVKTGGKASMIVFPKNEIQLVTVLQLIFQNQIPFFVLGNGSNVLASDKGFKGVVVKLNKYFGHIGFEGDLIAVGAGASTASVAAFAYESGLGGAEFLSAIPATMGGAVKTNAGCFENCVAEIVEKVIAVTKDGTQVFKKHQLLFDYRKSVFSNYDAVISTVFLKLTKKDKKEILKLTDSIKKTKRAAQPLDYPSFGSVFKRHDGVSAAVYIDKLGFKGFCIGGAKVSEKHANFFVNTGKANTEDFLTLIDIVGQKVRQNFGVVLKTEIQYIGDTNDLGRLSYSHFF